MSNIGAWFFEDDGQEQVDSFFHIKLLPHVEYFLYHPQKILDDLCFVEGEQINEGVAVALEDIDGEVRLEFVELSHHCDAMMGLDPVRIFNVGIQGV